MHLCTGEAGIRECLADLDPLDSLNGHEGSGKASIQPAIPVDVTSQSWWDTDGSYHDDAAQRILGPHGFFNSFLHALGSCAIGTADIVGFGQSPEVGERERRNVCSYLADTLHVAAHGNPKFRQEPASSAAHCYPRRCLSGTGPLQSEAQIAISVFLGCSEISMPRAWNSHAWDGPILPTGIVQVIYPQGNRSASGHALADATQDTHGVLLNLHPRPTAEASLAPSQLPVDILRRQGYTSRHAFYDSHEARAVGFSSRQETHGHSPTHRIIYNA